MELIKRNILRSRSPTSLPNNTLGSKWSKRITNMWPSCKIMSLGSWFCPKNYLTRRHLFDSEGHLFEMVGHLFDREGHLFDRKGHLFWEGSQFCYKLLGGRNFDHVYEPLRIFPPIIISRPTFSQFWVIKIRDIMFLNKIKSPIYMPLNSYICLTFHLFVRWTIIEQVKSGMI